MSSYDRDQGSRQGRDHNSPLRDFISAAGDSACDQGRSLPFFPLHRKVDPFTPERANATVLDAFLRTTQSSTDRDFSLLELVAPVISQVRLLATGEQDLLEGEENPGFRDAFSYLVNGTRKGLLFSLLTVRVANIEPMGPLYAIPTALYSMAAVAMLHRVSGMPTLRQMFQLQRLYGDAVIRLMTDPEVYGPVHEFLAQEREGSE